MTELRPIGTIRTPFAQKFGIPRQPNLVPEAEGFIELFPEFDQPGVYDGLEQSTHLWLLFLFHHQPHQWSPRVRPPRLGGNAKLGVFASRSPFRPNPIGLSVVKLLEVDQEKNRLRVGGVDLLDATPILDIKPYIPFCDSVAGAGHKLASAPPEPKAVSFSPQAMATLSRETLQLAEKILALDPRPAYHDDERAYGTLLQGFNIRWRVRHDRIEVESATAWETAESLERPD